MLNSRTMHYVIRTTKEGHGALDAAREMDRMADSMERTNDRMGRFGHETRKLDDDLKHARAEMQNFARAFAATGDEADRDLYRQAKRRVTAMERLMRDLVPDKKHGSLASWGAAYGIDFSQIAAESRGGLIAGAIGAGLIMSPIIAGTLATAVTGVFASGTVIGGGILAGLRSAEVQNAWKSLGHDVMAQLDPVTKEFEQPMIRAAERFRGAFDRARIVPTLQAAAKLVDPVADGLASVVESLGPGLEASAARGLPAVKAVFGGLTNVGYGITNMLDDFADAGDRSAIAFRDAFHYIAFVESEVGDLFEGLSDVYALTRSPLMKGLFGFDVPDVVPWFGLLSVIGKIGDHQERVTGSTRRLGNQFFESAEAAKAYAAALEAANKINQDYFHTAMSLDRANQSVADSWTRLYGSLGEFGGKWDMFSQGGASNRQAIMDLVDAFERQRQAAIEAGHGTFEAVTNANSAFDTQIHMLDNLVAKYRMAKPIRQDLILSYLIEFRVESYISQGAQLLLSLVGKGLSSMFGPGFGPGKGGKAGSSTSSGSGAWSTARDAWSHGGQFPGFASGGWAPANVPVVLGEHSPMGPMLTSFRRPTFIMPGSGESGGGGGAQRIELVFSGDSEIVALIRRIVKVKGGGNVQVALGSSSR